MDLRDDEEARLAETVGPALRRAGLRTKLLGYDHNWSLHPNDVGPPDDRANPNYADSLLDSPAARWFAGTAFHCYSGDPESQSALHDQHPDKDIYFTECSGTQSGNPATTFPDTLHWHTRFLTVGAVRN
jgi:glucosylceramidase